MSLSNKLSITDVDVKGKRVLIRVSFAPPSLPLQSRMLASCLKSRHDRQQTRLEARVHCTGDEA